MKRIRPAGFTLTEVMVALLITSLVIAGALQMYSVGRSGYQTSENLVRLEERAAYTLNMLSADIQQAGFWGRHSNGNLLAVPPNLPIHCAGNNVSAWAAQPAVPVAGTDGTYGLPCPAKTHTVANSDTLTLRFAGSGNVLPERGDIQIRANTIGGTLFSDGNLPNIAEPASTHDLHVYAWYLDSDSSEAPLPALRRHALSANGLIQNQEIMPGVEDFQIQFGIDHNADGLPDGFVDPEVVLAGTVVAVRVELRLRSALPEPGHVDSGPWQSIDPELPAIRPRDNLRRIAVQRTIALRNAGEVM